MKRERDWSKWEQWALEALDKNKRKIEESSSFGTKGTRNYGEFRMKNRRRSR